MLVAVSTHISEVGQLLGLRLPEIKPSIDTMFRLNDAPTVGKKCSRHSLMLVSPCCILSQTKLYVM